MELLGLKHYIHPWKQSMTDLAFRLVWLREQGCILSGKQHLAYICKNRGILHRSNKKDKSSFSGPTFLFEINHHTDCSSTQNGAQKRTHHLLLPFIDTSHSVLQFAQALRHYHLGSFTNYVDNFLTFDHLPTYPQLTK